MAFTNRELDPKEDVSLGFGNEGDLTQQLAANAPQPQQDSGLGITSGNDAANDPLRAAVDAQSGMGIAPPDATQVPPAGNTFADAIGWPKTPEGDRKTIREIAGFDPTLQKQQERHFKKQAQLEDLKGTITALEHGITMRQGMAPEDQAKFDALYGDKLEKVSPGMKATYDALSKRPDMLTQFQSYAPYLSEPMQIMLKSQPREFLKFAGTAEGMKALDEAKGRFDLRIASKKVQSTIAGLQHFVPPEMWKQINADGVVTATDIMQAQQYLPKALQLSDAQMESAQRNDKVFWQGLGVLHGEAEQAILKGRAKGAAPQHVDVDGKRYAFDPQGSEGTRLGTDKRYKLLGSAKDANTPNPQAKMDRETELKLADDYARDSKGYNDVKVKFQAAKSYVASLEREEKPAKPTSANDKALVSTYLKLLDPQDRIARGDIQDIGKLTGVPQSVVQGVQNLFKGKELDKTTRREIMDTIRLEFSYINRAQANTETSYSDRAKRYKLDHRNVVIPHSLALDPADYGGKPVAK